MHKNGMINQRCYLPNHHRNIDKDSGLCQSIRDQSIQIKNDSSIMEWREIFESTRQCPLPIPARNQWRLLICPCLPLSLSLRSPPLARSLTLKYRVPVIDTATWWKTPSWQRGFDCSPRIARYLVVSDRRLMSVLSSNRVMSRNSLSGLFPFREMVVHGKSHPWNFRDDRGSMVKKQEICCWKQ